MILTTIRNKNVDELTSFLKPYAYTHFNKVNTSASGITGKSFRN